MKFILISSVMVIFFGCVKEPLRDCPTDVQTMSIEAKDIYMMDGEVQSRSVQSSTDWKLVVVKNTNPNSQRVVSSQEVGAIVATGTSTSSTTVYFTTYDGVAEGIAAGEFEVKLVPTDPNIDASAIKSMRCIPGFAIPENKQANSYMIKPTIGVVSRSILFPVTHGNTGLGRIHKLVDGATEVYAELLWTDVCGSTGKGIEADAAVSKIETIGTTFDKAQILVTAGTKEGNALIAIKDRATNEVLWSWHIWVVRYTPDPSKAVWMDRNLGAITNFAPTHDTDIRSHGFYYQWGRKDPFPANYTAIAGQSAVRSQDTYDATQMRSTTLPTKKLITDFDLTTPAQNLVNAIKHPENFYYIYDTSNTDPHDWFTDSYAKREDDLWGGETKVKTVYDPCPEGWRTPIQDGKLSADPTGKLWFKDITELTLIQGDGITAPLIEQIPNMIGNPYCYGIQWAQKGGFYPYAGVLLSSDVVSMYDYVGGYGFYYAANTASNTNSSSYGLTLIAHSEEINSSMLVRSHGAKIRCVLE